MENEACGSKLYKPTVVNIAAMAAELEPVSVSGLGIPYMPWML